MRLLGVLTIALTLQAGLGAQTAVAAEKCRPRHLAIADLPGPEVGIEYKEVRAQIPKGSACNAASSDGCSFVDHWGYENYFTEIRNGEGYIFARFGLRARHPHLPYGVAWSDGPAQVTRKLKALGQNPMPAPEGTDLIITVVGCFRSEIGDGFWTDFHFDKSGRLIEMKRAVLYP